MNKITISIDAMGGDYGPSVTVPAALRLLAKYPDIYLILVGRQEVLDKVLAASGGNRFGERLTIKHATEEVLMDEAPAKALRGKKDSSMRVAINLVKSAVANACVSAGNTGALVAIARFVLKTLPGIDRPAITTHFPTRIPDKVTNMLDLGANVDSKAEYLCQFALMGSVLSSVVDNIVKPKVALLNIGSEEIKGNEQIKVASQMLSGNKNINYVGYVEGDDLFKGEVDVIVSDGFIGNIVLKTIEGAIKLVGFYAKKSIMRNIFTKISGLLALPLLRSLQKEVDPNRYNGATLVGLQGVVIKSHGSANTTAFFHSLEKAVIEAEKNIPQKIHDELARVLEVL